LRFTIRELAVTESTNDDAAKLLGDPAAAGSVLVTNYQRAGRGRRSRAWIAPPGCSLLFTAILPEPIATAALWAVPFWTALGVANGIEDACGLRLGLQWPNDLLLGGRKCAGILGVSRVAGDRTWVGCGVGINVHRPQTEDPELAAIVPPPAFLADMIVADAVAAPERETVVRGTRDATAMLATRKNAVPLRRDMLVAILDRFEATLHDFDDPLAIARAWETRAKLADTRYRLAIDGEPVPLVAAALRLADGGALVVREHAGAAERRIALADARVLRG